MAQGLQGLDETGRSDYGYEQYGAGMSFGEYLEQLGKLGARTGQNLAGYAYDLPRDIYSAAAGGIVNPMRQMLSAGEAEPIPTDLYPSYFEQQQPGVAQAGVGGYQDPVGPGEQAADYLTPMVDMAFDPIAKVAGAAAGLAGLSRLTKAAHGSPHVFDEFSMGKMGTGEGAQAYGHGLYFADVDPTTGKSAVAESYRKSLIDPMEIKVLGSTVGEKIEEFQRQADRLPIDQAGEIYERSAFLEDLGLTDNFDEALSRVDDEITREWAEGIRHTYELPGATYNVDLTPDADDWLDWDAPLSEQSPKVREALEPMTGKIVSTPTEQIEIFLDSDYAKSFPDSTDVALAKNALYEDGLEGGTDFAADWVDKQFNKQTYSSFKTMFGPGGINEDPTGSALYAKVSKDLGSPQAATEYLDSIGIPGHKYFDQMSRSEGAGTRNYVVYNDDYIDITHRDGKPVTNKREALEASRDEP